MSDGMVIEDMVEIPAGRFRIVPAAFYPEEGPVREVEVDGFAIQHGPVTVAEFACFTRYRSVITPRATSNKPKTAAAITSAGRPRRPIQSLN